MEIDGYIISTSIASLIMFIGVICLVVWYYSKADWRYLLFAGGILLVIVSIVIIVLEWFYPEYSPSTLLSGGYSYVYSYVEDGWYDIMELLGLYSTEDIEDVVELIDEQLDFENNSDESDGSDDEPVNQNSEDDEEVGSDDEPVNETNMNDMNDMEDMENVETFTQSDKDTFVAYVKSSYGPLYGKMTSMLYNTEAIQSLRSRADREAAIENIIQQHISGNKRGFKRILKDILKKRRNPLA